MPNAQQTWTKFYNYAPCYVEDQLNSTFFCPSTKTPWNDPLCSGNNGFNPFNEAGCCDCKYINYKYPAPHAYSNGSFYFVYGWVCLGTFIAVLFAYFFMLMASLARPVLPGCRITSFNMSGRRMWAFAVALGAAAVLGQFIAFSIWYIYVSLIGFNVLGYIAPYFALGASRVGVMMHSLAGALWMLGVVLQFTPFIRRRYPVVHRMIGMLTMLSLIVTAAGLFLLVSGPHQSGFGGFFAGWTFGLYWIFCGVMGVINIKARRIQEHRIWMIRTVYLGFGIICERAPQGLIAKYLPLSTFLGADYAALLAAPQYATIAKGVVILYKQWYLGATFWWCEAWAVFFGEAYLYLAFDAGLFTTILGPRRGYVAAPIYLLPMPAKAAIDDDPPPLPPIRSTGWKEALLGSEEAHAEVVLPTRGRGLRQVIRYLDHTLPLTFTARRAAGRHAQLLYLSLPHPFMSFSAAPGHDLALTTYVKGKRVVRTYTPVLFPPEIADLDPLMTPSSVVLLVKNIEGGLVSPHLSDMASGEQLYAEGGLGIFSFIPGAYSRIGILAGGSGITGVLSVMTAALCDPWDTSRIDLIYVNNFHEDILLKPQLDAMAKLFNDRLTITYVVTSGNPPSGKHYDQGGDFLLAPRISTVPRARNSIQPAASTHNAPPPPPPPPAHTAVVVAPPKAAPSPPPPPVAAKEAEAAALPVVVAADVAAHGDAHAVIPPPPSNDISPLTAHRPSLAPGGAHGADEVELVPLAPGGADTPLTTATGGEFGTAASRVTAPTVIAPAPTGMMSTVKGSVAGALAQVTKPLSPEKAAQFAAAGLPQPQVARQAAPAPPEPLPLSRRQLPPGPLRMAMSKPPPAPFPPPPGPAAPTPTEPAAPAVAEAPAAAAADEAALAAELAALPEPEVAKLQPELTLTPDGGATEPTPVVPAAEAAELPREDTAAVAAAPKAVEEVAAPKPVAVNGPAKRAGDYIPVPAIAFYSQPPRPTVTPPGTAKGDGNAAFQKADLPPLPPPPPPAGRPSAAAAAADAAPAGHGHAPSVNFAPPQQPFQPPVNKRPAFLSNSSSTKVVYGPVTPEILSATPLVKDKPKPGEMQLLICGPLGFNFAMMSMMGKLGQPSAHTWAFGTSDR